MESALDRTEFTELPLIHRGKVRDLYDLGQERCLIVSTDRVSAFDFVLSPGIPGKGRILNQISKFWFEMLGVEHHLISTEVPSALAAHRAVLEGRVAVVKKAEVIPVECVVRGYLTGSGYKEYQSTGQLGFQAMPKGLREAERLAPPRFTPTTKAKTGHDEPLTPQGLRDAIGAELAKTLEERSLEIFEKGSRYAAERGLLLADTKFEWGFVGGRLTLVDEVLTPDSSRFWEAKDWQPGRSPQPLDKQVIRNYLLGTAWDRHSPPPSLSSEIVAQAAATYRQLAERLLGRPL